MYREARLRARQRRRRADQLVARAQELDRCHELRPCVASDAHRPQGRSPRDAGERPVAVMEKREEEVPALSYHVDLLGDLLLSSDTALVELASQDVCASTSYYY